MTGTANAQRRRRYAAQPSALSPDTSRRRIGTARRADLRPATITKLIHDPDQEVRATVAANENVAANRIVLDLAADSSPLVRASVAQRTDLPPGVLQAAADDPAPMVRQSVATNVRTGRALSNGQLWALANDSHTPTRVALAARVDLPPTVVEHLAEDHSQTVQLTIARYHGARIRLNPLLLAQFAGLAGADDAMKAWGLPPRSDWRRLVACAQPNAPLVALIAVLARGPLVNTLVSSADPVVRAAVLFNSRVSDTQRQNAMADDPDESVKAAAHRSQQLRSRVGAYA